MKSLLHRFVFVGTIFLLVISAVSQDKPDPWLLFADGERGAINAHTTRKDLVRIYGPSNVVDKDVDIGEGETEAGTVLFPKDPEREIEILWQDNTTTQPKSVQIQGRSSRWKAVNNISLGTALKTLEQLNGRPFKLAGFAWDYAGTVYSWETGSLAAEFDSGHGHVFLRLDSNVPPVADKDVNEVMGDREFSSSHRVMQKLNPTVYQIIWVFPSPQN